MMIVQKVELLQWRGLLTSQIKTNTMEIQSASLDPVEHGLLHYTFVMLSLLQGSSKLPSCVVLGKQI